MNAQPVPEFSRPVSADAVPSRETEERLRATPQECAALARRFDLPSISSLVATVRTRRVRGGQMIRVAGTLEAEVEQTCVVTLEPFPSLIKDSFSALFAPPHLIPREDPDADPAAWNEEEDAPEPIENGRIDLGELVAQHLSLALDPYPRKPGITFSHIEDPGEEGEGAEVIRIGAESGPESGEDGGGEPKRPNPFAALASLKPKS
ncbi:MAG TPA: DUF177 domain-containing protein [Azospirillaceae bacterium]|nr:DUF177 domain-containing protein [Azospirillaceae bacterium]